VLLVLFLGGFAIVARPQIVAGHVPGASPDCLDYAYGAQALLHGSYVVQWLVPPSAATVGVDGLAHIPQYPPGYPILLVPAVALGGIAAAVWVNLGCGLLLGALAAWLAARLSDLRAAPLAAVAVLCSIGAVVFSQTVMSDLPTATLLMAEALVLVHVRSPRAALMAGLLAGALVWIRTPNLVLIFAGLAGITALPDRRRLVGAFIAGALLLPGLLVLWQLATYGSPWTTGYGAVFAGAQHLDKPQVTSLFRLQYVFGEPLGRSGLSRELIWSNARLYALGLAGYRFWICLPGVSLIGLFAALRYAPRRDERGAMGRFAIAVLLATLATYLPYDWQDVRYMFGPAVLLNTLAAVALAPRAPAAVSGLRIRLPRRPRSGAPAQITPTEQGPCAAASADS
jgi:4-amino-4-deoxy-L-arabinose transferase-like glycosyltransferase